MGFALKYVSSDIHLFFARCSSHKFGRFLLVETICRDSVQYESWLTHGKEVVVVLHRPIMRYCSSVSRSVPVVVVNEVTHTTTTTQTKQQPLALDIFSSRCG